MYGVKIRFFSKFGAIFLVFLDYLNLTSVRQMSWSGLFISLVFMLKHTADYYQNKLVTENSRRPVGCETWSPDLRFETPQVHGRKNKSFFLKLEPLVAKTLLLGRPGLSWATGGGLLSISVPPGRYPRPLVDMEASYGWWPASIDGRPH